MFPQENISPEVEEHGAFAGCFILNGDRLNQFRLYGKEKDEEGTGVSVTLNEHFFSKEILAPVQMRLDEGKKKEDLPNLLPLFRCIYIDPETNKVVSLGQKEEYVFCRENEGKNDKDKKKVYRKYKNKINATMGEVSKKLDNLKKYIKREKLNYDVVREFLRYLRYLVKHVAFKEEQECRIIRVEKLCDKKNVKSDEDNRLYVEYSVLNKWNISKICFGPKAKGINKFKQHLVRNGYDEVKCGKSKAPLS